MKKVNFKYFIYFLLGIFLFSSCDKLLDVNDNPNYPTQPTLTNLLPSACTTTFSQYGLWGSLIGSMWMQYTTQGNSTNQYNTTVNYSILTSDYNGFWTNAYANTIPDLNIMIKKAETDKAWNYFLIGKVLKAYNFMMLADLYETIPFTEANDPNIKLPKYDDGKTVVYPGIIALLDEAIAAQPKAIDKTNSIIGIQDMYFNGNIAKWVAFAKSLKLKAYLKDFNANNAKISALLNEGGLLEEDCAMTTFEDATSKGNPLYEYNIRQLNTRENMRACHTFLEFLIANNDPRIEAIYEVTANAQTKINDGEILTYTEKYEGIGCGARPETTVLPLTATSRYKQSYNDPVYLMNKAEAEFLIAEAYARLNNAVQAKTYYDKGVTAAFDRFTPSAGKAGSFLSSGQPYAFNSTSMEGMLNSILTQKWASYAKANALDAVFDRNRTGIPAIDAVRAVRVDELDKSKGLTPGYVLGTLVAPAASALQATDFPRRLMIPDISKQYNANAPVTKKIEEPMWWQVARGK